MLTTLLACAAAHAHDFTRNEATGLPIKWPAGVVTLRLKVDNTTVLPGDGTTRATTLMQALQAWNAQLAAVQFAGAIQSVSSAGQANRVNEVTFETTMFGQAFDVRTLAVTFTLRSGNATTETDVIFNANRTWDSYRGARRSGRDDIRRVALHEFGHVLGLAHPDQATPAQTVSAVMNSIVSDIDALMADDVAGAQVLYGPPGIPGNDHFAQAAAIALLNDTARVTGYNTTAGHEPGEPRHADNVGAGSVWWTWTAPTSGNVFVTTQGSIFDTTLGVYTGTAVAALAMVASSDDLNPGIVQYSALNFNATAGTKYYFAVDGFDGDSGFIALNVTLAREPMHSADSDRDRRLNLREIARVIELYNTRNASVRTGAYKVQAGTEDGFAPDPARGASTVAALSRYHDGDLASGSRDGRISLAELMRVIELYNYRAGSVRTGQYRDQAGTEDGFATGP